MRSDRLRALNAPQAVTVELDQDGMPVAIRRTGGRMESSTTRPPHRLTVVQIRDTWRLDDEWWRCPIARRYLDVTLEGGGRMVLYENLVTGEWFTQG
jgi:hypothetical protein